MDVVVCGTADSIMMVEGGAMEVSEEDVVEGLKIAQGGMKELIAAQEELIKKVGKDRPAKMEWTKDERPADVEAKVKATAESKIQSAINQKDKHGRIEAVEKAKKEAKEALKAEFPDAGMHISAALGDLEYNILRAQVLDTGLRVDGRKPTAVRAISIDAPILPRAHGSALFTRGQTQALVAITLGTANDVQRLDSIDEAKD